MCPCGARAKCAFSSADPACGSSHPTAKCSTSAQSICRMVARTGAAAAGTAVRIPSLCCSQGTRLARTSTDCTRSSTMPLRHLCRRREALGRPARSALCWLRARLVGMQLRTPCWLNPNPESCTCTVAHVCLQSWRMYSSQSHSRHSRFALKSELHRVGVRPSGLWAGSTGRLRLAMSSQWRSPGCRPRSLVRLAHAGSTKPRGGQVGRAAGWRAAPDRQ